MSDADGAQVEDEGGAFECVAELLLVDRYRVNQDVLDRGADLVPLGAVIPQAAQNHRSVFGDLDEIVVRMFAANGDSMGRNVGRWIEAGRHRVGNYLGSFRRGDLKRIMAEKLDGHVGLSGVGGF